MESRVSIQSFDWRTLQVVKKIAPEIPTVYLSAQQRSLDNIGADMRQAQPGRQISIQGLRIGTEDGQGRRWADLVTLFR